MSRFLLCFLGMICEVMIQATPSSTFWTNCTTDIQTTGTALFNVTNYFSVFNRRHHGSSLPPDVSLLMGAFTWEKISTEIGVDYFGGTDDPLVFSGKIGVVENTLFEKAPSFNIGIFNIGTRQHGHGRTNQNVVDFIIGRTLPDGSNIYAAFYSGSKALGKNRQGYMVAWKNFYFAAVDSDGAKYKKWFIAMDYASGKNYIGGGGASFGYYFNSNVYVQTGPVFFNTSKYNGTWKWGVQLYINFPVFKTKEEK